MGNKLGRLSAQSGQNFRRLMRGLGPFLAVGMFLSARKKADVPRLVFHQGEL
jgi:hypothetical protein